MSNQEIRSTIKSMLADWDRLTKVEDYILVASNGHKIRKATKVTFPSGQAIKFIEKLSRKEAIKQANAQIG